MPIATTLTASPGTDIWRKPPDTDILNAPTHPSPLLFQPLRSFRRARLTLTLPPISSLARYDQAGLLLHLRRTPTPSTATEATEATNAAPDKWLKTGVEFANGVPWLSTVACDNWADWSVTPLPAAAAAAPVTATVEARREIDAHGTSLWVYALELDSEEAMVKRTPLREVAWFFAAEEGWEVGVGAYAARPGHAREGLRAEVRLWEEELGEGGR